MHARTPLAAAAVLLAVLLTGCTGDPEPRLTALPGISATLEPSASPSVPTLGPSAGAATDCVDGVLALSGARQEIDVAGSCTRVEVSGTDLEIDLERAEVSEVVVRGDRNDVDASALDSVIVEGQGNEIGADAVGAASLSGDRNSLDVDGALGSLVIRGNDNEVEAARIDASDVQGDRNEVPSH